MTWTHLAVPGKPGVWRLYHDGVEAGDLALDHPYPTVLAGHVVAALNDFDQTVTRTQRDELRIHGWPSTIAYEEEVETNRQLVDQFPPSVRAECATAFARHGWTYPLRPDQMTEWQDELLTILAAHATEAVA